MDTNAIEWANEVSQVTVRSQFSLDPFYSILLNLLTTKALLIKLFCYKCFTISVTILKDDGTNLTVSCLRLIKKAQALEN